MINRNEVGSIGSIGAILGRFGFGSKTDNNKDKIVQLNKSRRIIENAIFRKVKINDSEDFIANHIINNLDSLGKWAKMPWYLKPFKKDNVLKDFRFSSGNFSEFNDTSNMALKTVYAIVVGDDQGGKGTMSNGYDEDSGILYVSNSTHNPDLSVALTNSIFDNLSQFYIEKTIEKQKATYEIVKSKTDSILNLLKKKEIELAAFEDRAHGLFSSKSKLTELRLKRDVQKLSLMYGESIKNLEIADFAVKNKTPYIQAIDRPILPLRAEKPSTIKSFILGGILGLFLVLVFLFFKKIYRDAMSL
ncbi:MAG TPA: hypothetical protein ENK91_01835 [Bacteroidetes bacterium]|nr:hypothetical protein [Bacteroidota bacterium]